LSDSGVHGVPHWLFAPQTCPPPHEPQLETVRLRPQLSVPLFAPQTAPRRRQKVALSSLGQMHWLLWQTVPAPQAVPHARVRSVPQLSAAVSVPHWAAFRWQNFASLSGMHAVQLLTLQV
jgi:hypothetical protein